ncbi:MAG TPA: DUF1697 domain-containing protein [Xanthobacteraceae bacterium]|jgi:uncharacterized protein (DUF1697 family)|nr:DUF1697 domain-containing protein [Xanthobacteraceae bacterium]
MAVFIALLRAVNVGGTGKLPMSDLKAACEEAGLRNVSTYIASGNLVFQTGKSAASLTRLIGNILRDRFALTKNQVFLRTPDRVAQVIAGNPFAAAAEKRPNHLMVSFLERAPQPGTAAALAAYRGPEQLQLDGDHLYIDYAETPAKSKLTPAFFDRTLGVSATARNWNTTNKLLAMARALKG